MTQAKLHCFPLAWPPSPWGAITQDTPNVAEMRDSYRDPRRLASRVIAHEGVDIGVTPGALVVAAMSGRVIAARWSGLGGWAVLIRSTVEGPSGAHHDTLYAHMMAQPLVQAQQDVSVGQLLGFSGQTGGVEDAKPGTKFAHFPHLHFSVKRNEVAWNPIVQLLGLTTRFRDGYRVPPATQAQVQQFAASIRHTNV